MGNQRPLPRLLCLRRGALHETRFAAGSIRFQDHSFGIPFFSVATVDVKQVGRSLRFVYTRLAASSLATAFAVPVREVNARPVSDATKDSRNPLHRNWLAGWRCSPERQPAVACIAWRTTQTNTNLRREYQGWLRRTVSNADRPRCSSPGRRESRIRRAGRSPESRRPLRQARTSRAARSMARASSSIFRRERGKAVRDFIREQRAKQPHAIGDGQRLSDAVEQRNVGQLERPLFEALAVVVVIENRALRAFSNVFAPMS